MSAPAEALRSSAVFNLSGAATLVVDSSPFSTELTSEALRGFGIRNIHTCRDAERAMQVLKQNTIDLVIVDFELPGMKGHDLVRWLRHSRLDPNADIPAIITASHVRRSKLGEVRDCGANFLITRPFSMAVLLSRIVWVARDLRPILEAGDYKGPDRRFAAAQPREDGERRADMLRLLEEQREAAPPEACTL